MTAQEINKFTVTQHSLTIKQDPEVNRGPEGRCTDATMQGSQQIDTEAFVVHSALQASKALARIAIIAIVIITFGTSLERLLLLYVLL